MSPINTVSGKLADFICNLQIEQLPKSVIERTKTRLLDCLATGLAAHGLHVPSVVLAFTEGGVGPARVIGYQKSLPIVDAAFVNATLINGRSQDDFMQKSHPGALTIPAALGFAQAFKRGGADVLVGMVAGYEVVGRMYMGAPGMVPKFRASGVAGTVGAAATAAKMLRLDSTLMMNALGCSAVFAHGFGQGFFAGTNEVKLNVGMASRNGVTAALLAKHGATASALAFEGEAGYFRAFDGSLEHAEAATRGLGESYLIEETVYKECPVCIFTQTPIALARTLAAKIDLNKIQKVVVTSPELTHTNPGFTNVAPYQTHLQAVVSARFCTAAALLGRPVEDYDYYDELQDPELLHLAEKIELRMREHDTDTVDVEVFQTDGVIRASGTENETLFPSLDKVIEKFFRITSDLPGLDRDRIVETVMTLDQVADIQELMKLLVISEALTAAR